MLLLFLHIAIAILRGNYSLGLLVGHNKEHNVQFDRSYHTVTIVASSVPKYFSHRSHTMSIRGRGAKRSILPITQGRLYYSRYYTRAIKLGTYPK